MNEKIKPIVLTDTETNKSYTLEFSRDSVSFAEQRGFLIEDMEKYPQTKVREFFWYAFRMHHKNLAKVNTDALLEKWFGGVADIPEAIIERLAELWSATFTTSTGDDEEPKKDNVMVEM